MKFLIISVYISFMLATTESIISTRLRNGYYDDNLPSKKDSWHIEQVKQDFLADLIKKSLDGIEKIAVQLEDAVDLINRSDRKTLVEYLKNSSRGLDMIFLLLKEKALLKRSHPQKVYLIVKDSKKLLGDIMYILSISLQLIVLPEEQACYDIVWRSIGELADVTFKLDKVVETLEEFGHKTEHLNLHPSHKDSEDLNLTQKYDTNAQIIRNLPEELNRQNKTEKAEVLRSTNGSPTAIITRKQNQENSTAQVGDSIPQSVGSQRTNVHNVDSKVDATNVQNGNNGVQQNTGGRLQIAETQKSKVTDHKANNIRLQNNNNGILRNNLVAKPQISRSHRSSTGNKSSQVTMAKPQKNVKNVIAQDVMYKRVKNMHNKVGAEEKVPKTFISKVSNSDSHSTAQGVISKAVDGKSQGSAKNVKVRSNTEDIKSQSSVKNVKVRSNVEDVDPQNSVKNEKVGSKVKSVKSQGGVKNVKIRSNVANIASQGVVSKINESNKQRVAVSKDVKHLLPNKKLQDKKSQCINGVLYRGSPICCVSLTFTIRRN